MPLMCGPGAIATILGMTATIKQSSTELESFVAIVAAILATMFVTYLCLAYASNLSKNWGRWGLMPSPGSSASSSPLWVSL